MKKHRHAPLAWYPLRLCSGVQAAGLQPSGMEKSDWYYDDLKQAGFDLLSAEYADGVYADYLARKTGRQ